MNDVSSLRICATMYVCTFAWPPPAGHPHVRLSTDNDRARRMRTLVSIRPHGHSRPVYSKPERWHSRPNRWKPTTVDVLSLYPASPFVACRPRYRSAEDHLQEACTSKLSRPRHLAAGRDRGRAYMYSISPHHKFTHHESVSIMWASSCIWTRWVMSPTISVYSSSLSSALTPVK